tara:strand:- start:118 stop:1005 length:888 start_codon:yes stop_codon:yes gene_type:complete
MHGSKKTHKSWLKNYKVAKVFNNGRLYIQTLKYLKKQTNLNYPKVLFLFNNFINKKYPICNVLLYEKKIVGFVGTIFSQKKYNKKKFLNCNIHSWMVDTNHRIGSSMLINQIKQNCIITVLSSLPRLEKTFLKLGFKKFNMKYKIIFIKKFFAKNIKLSFDILHNQNFLMKKTNKSQQKIIKDYNNSRFKKFIFFNSISKKNCLIIGDVTKKKRFFKTLNIIYCSNTSFLKKNIFIFYTLIQKYFKVHFCGEFYINKSKSILKKSNLSKIINKTIYLKRTPKNYQFDLLYSETEF